MSNEHSCLIYSKTNVNFYEVKDSAFNTLMTKSYRLSSTKTLPSLKGHSTNRKFIVANKIDKLKTTLRDINCR